ncbi:hypothetical protein SAMN05444673_2827 [Bacillus sp. OV166]|uniref:hypothetical protein n=1 Tax=Bacillus sp. OV166 TaxID=1882763 RepID=UPI000A2AAF2C|nr:hypothetical protein [Bacillus sp. OV166]SMQ77499.1 hypothetical protein SAMN05444673_2827 [Bacillus sp. OV166]
MSDSLINRIEKLVIEEMRGICGDIEALIGMKFALKMIQTLIGIDLTLMFTFT